MVILFDLDGTLIDTAQGIINSFVYAFENIGYQCPKKTEMRKFIGPPLRDTFMGKLKFSQERSDEAIRFFEKYCTGVGKYENSKFLGMGELLSYLNSKYILAVATSKPQDQAEDILKYYSIDKYFKFIGGASKKLNRHDKHDIIEYVLTNLSNKKINVDRRKIYMVGDKYTDILGAEKSNIHSIGVTWGYGDREELEKVNAEYIIDSISDLKELIELLNLE